MVRPRIALPSPTSTDLPYNRKCLPQYAAAIERSGGEAVAISSTASPREMTALAATCSGLLLPGSPADMRPGRYGQTAEAATAATDVAREDADVLLLEEAQSRGKPVLGICFGLQSINVWRGGTLVQDVSVLPVNHAAGSAVQVAHTVTIATDSMLAGLAEADEVTMMDSLRRVPVNSSHHQAIGITGEGLRVAARCPQDGVVEAIEAESAILRQWLMAVQWHPERTFDSSATSRALFQRLVAEAR